MTTTPPPNAGTGYLREQAALEDVVNALLADSDLQERTFMHDRQLYRVTAQRLTDAADIKAATSQMFGGRS
ncbi:hypothetical protein ACUN8C_05735 [Kushneria sp. Sum13]|uniref:hypothetical protein n=1 Tax=Kushneria sp. Sum13 TaxID=3459196 RepID=UPI0040458EE9